MLPCRAFVCTCEHPTFSFCRILPAQDLQHSTSMILAPNCHCLMSMNYGWRATSGAGSKVALGTETGAGQAAAAAGKSPLTGMPGAIPGTPGIPGTSDPGMPGGRRMTGGAKRRVGAVANSPVLTEEMRRTDILSTIKALSCHLTISSEHANTGKSRTWMGSGSGLRTLVRLCLLLFLMNQSSEERNENSTCTFWRQSNEKPGVILGWSGSKLRYIFPRMHCCFQSRKVFFQFKDVIPYTGLPNSETCGSSKHEFTQCRNMLGGSCGVLLNC